MSSTLADRFSTTGSRGKSQLTYFYIYYLLFTLSHYSVKSMIARAFVSFCDPSKSQRRVHLILYVQYIFKRDTLSFKAMFGGRLNLQIIYK